MYTVLTTALEWSALEVLSDFLSLVVDCTLTVNGASQTPPGSGDVFEISGIKSPSSAGE